MGMTSTAYVRFVGLKAVRGREPVSRTAKVLVFVYQRGLCSLHFIGSVLFDDASIEPLKRLGRDGVREEYAVYRVGSSPNLRRQRHLFR